MVLTSKTTGAKKAPRARKTKSAEAAPTLLTRILTSLDDDKAEDIVTIDLDGRSSLADAIVIANGRSQRHVSSIAEHLARRLKEAGYGTRPVDGLKAATGCWSMPAMSLSISSGPRCAAITTSKACGRSRNRDAPRRADRYKALFPCGFSFLPSDMLAELRKAR